MRQIILMLLFALLFISLNRDETWALPRLLDGHLTETDLRKIIDRSLPVPQIVALPECECDPPADSPKTVSEVNECDCALDIQVGWICGTPIHQAEAEIREAIEAGLHPWAIAQLIERNCTWLGTCKPGHEVMPLLVGGL